jgi:RNA polymerase sigma-70 factor (ECF subfamily)
MATRALNAWIVRAQAGDEVALESAMAEIRRGVLRFLIVRGHSLHDAEDLTQDICLNLLRSMPGWRDTGSSYWAFVFSVTRNKVADRHRTVGRDRSVPLAEPPEVADTDPGPEEQVLVAEGVGRMAELLDELSPTHRDLLVLRVVVGLNTQETADTLGLSRGSVHVLQHRALAKLRTLTARRSAAAASEQP